MSYYCIKVIATERETNLVKGRQKTRKPSKGESWLGSLKRAAVSKEM